MQHLTVEAVQGTSVEIDLCQRCRAFWFDPFETLHLTPRSTLELFRLISDQTNAAAAPWSPTCHCPRCGGPLLPTHDRQRNTPFQYWRCDQGHGRFTPFIDFLREKEYIRPPSPQEVAELRQKIQFVHCSNCGAPIDLTIDSVCPHCNAPLSILDMKKMVDIGQDARSGTTPAAGHDRGPALPLLKPAAPTPSVAGHPPRPVNLVDLGLQTISEWLTTWLE